MSPPTVTIASIVEGHGEVPSLPRLLHRIAGQHAVRNLRTPKPWREPRDRLIIAGGIERVVTTVAEHITGAGGVLVLVDADDDCPAELGAGLLKRAQAARPDIPVRVVLAKSEFETWFVAAAPSLAGANGFPDGLADPPDPEGIRGAKEWLRDHRSGNSTYQPTVDQPLLTSVFDLDLARAKSPSFAKFCRDVESLLLKR